MDIYHGTIIPCKPGDDTLASWLAVEKGRIAFVGTHLPEVHRSIRPIELGRSTIVPSFTDTHLHFSSWAHFVEGLYIRGAESIDVLKDRIAAFARENDDRIILGFGASPHAVRERRALTRADLDAVVPNRPVIIVKYDGHAAYANSKLLEALPGKVKRVRGFQAETGRLELESFYAGIDWVTRSVPTLKLLRHLQKGIDRLTDWGVGMVHAVEGVGFPGDLDVDLMRVVARGQRDPFQFRIFFQTMDVRKVLKRKLPRIGGCFATALDGCFGSVDAALTEPYSDDPGNKGVLFYRDDEVARFCTHAHQAGLQIALHAIGDAAFDQAVAALKTAIASAPRPDHRHIIIHASLPSRVSLEQCAELGICIASQPAFLRWQEEPHEYLERKLGERTQNISPHRTMLELGIHVAGGSDGPCTTPNPLEGIECAVSHPVPEQSLTTLEALRMYTWEAAYLSFDEDERGSLEAGKRADFAVLSGNPLESKPDELGKLEVERLYLEGRPVRHGQRVPSVLARGLLNGKKEV